MQELSSESIVEILRNEHNVVRKNLAEILEGQSINQEVMSKTANAIMNHFNGEEKLVFPKFESMPQSRRLTYELYEQHSTARKLISEIGQNSAPDTDRWFAKVKFLDELINAHFKLEEDEVFPKAEELLSEEELKTIGSRYKNKQF